MDGRGGGDENSSVASGGINVKVEPGLTGCTSQSGYGASYASVYPDHKGLNSIHSNLLAAYMSGKKYLCTLRIILVN